jgi:hypothetical protein
MNISVKPRGYNRRNSLLRDLKRNENVNKSFVNQGCQSEETVDEMPVLKVSIRQKITNEHSRIYPNPVQLFRPMQPESFIKVKSILSKPLVFSKNKSLTGFVKENSCRSSSSRIEKRGIIYKGSAFSKKVLSKLKFNSLINY